MNTTTSFPNSKYFIRSAESSSRMQSLANVSGKEGSLTTGLLSIVSVPVSSAIAHSRIAGSVSWP